MGTFEIQEADAFEATASFLERGRTDAFPFYFLTF
jgi:hypothetical protein